MRLILTEALSALVFGGILLMDGVLYAGVISTQFFLVIFLLLFAWNWITGKGPGKAWHRRITAALLCMEILVFLLSLPTYTTARAAARLVQSEEGLTVTECHAMDTVEALRPFVKKGYVFVCTESAAGRQRTFFFNPVSGEYYEMSSR